MHFAVQLMKLHSIDSEWGVNVRNLKRTQNTQMRSLAHYYDLDHVPWHKSFSDCEIGQAIRRIYIFAVNALNELFGVSNEFYALLAFAV